MLAMLRADEVYTCQLRGEDSTFVRFNRGKVGQAGEVHQRQLDIDLIRGRRHARGAYNTTGILAADLARLARLFDRLREMREASSQDPLLDYNTDLAASSEVLAEDRLPSGDAVLEVVASVAQGADLVGIYASGGVHRGFASSLGQRNWHSSFNFNFDWSVFEGSDAAVKSGYAGVDWAADAVAERIRRSREDLRVLCQPRRRVAPGQYRVYLAPAALNEVFSVLGWDGFGLRGWKAGTSPLQRLHNGENHLDERIEISEDIGNGAAPRFDGSGFPRPDIVPLVRRGRVAGHLVSSRSGREFGVPNNGANPSEAPTSLDVGAGEIDSDSILDRLHTGLLV